MKPVAYKELVDALGTLLGQYAELDEMLDSFMESAEPTRAEEAKQRRNNRARDRVQKIFERAVISGQKVNP